MKKLIISIALMLSFGMAIAQNQISELLRGSIFHWAGNEWNPTRDLVSGTNGTATAVYATSDRQGSGNTRNLSYNGTSDVTTLPASMPPFSTGDFTVIRKVKTGALGAIRSLIGGAANSFGLYISATGYLIAIKYGGSTLTVSTTLLAANTEYKLAYIKSGSTGTYYVNNTAAGTTTDTNDYSVKCTLLGNGTGFFNGLDFMTRCFNFALTPTVQLVNYSCPEYPIEWVDKAESVLLNGWNFTSGWSTASLTTINDLNTFTVTAGSRGVYKTGLFTVGKVHKIRIAGTISAGTLNIKNVDGGTTYLSVIGTFNTSAIFTPVVDGGIYLTPTEAATVDITSMSIDNCVLDLNAEGISTSGYWYDRTNSTAASGYTSVAATVSGASVSIPSASNLGAMAFNGSTSKVLFADQPDYSLPNNNISFSFNLNANKLVENSGVFGKHSTGSTREYMVVSNANGNLVIYFFSGGSTTNYTYFETPASTILVNTFYKICFVYKNSIGTVYVNNIPITTTRSNVGSGFSTFLDTASSIAVGCNEADAFYFNGVVYNIKIYKEALDADRIKLLNDTN